MLVIRQVGRAAVQIEARVLVGVLGPPGRSDAEVGDAGGERAGWVGTGEPAGAPREREPGGELLS